MVIIYLQIYVAYLVLVFGDWFLKDRKRKKWLNKIQDEKNKININFNLINEKESILSNINKSKSDIGDK